MATQIAAPTTTAQQLLTTVWCLVENGQSLVDDISGRPIRGIEHYADLLDIDSSPTLSSLGDKTLAQLAEGDRPADLEAELRELLDSGVVAAHAPAPWDDHGRSPADLARTRERRIKATALIAEHVLHALGPFAARA